MATREFTQSNLIDTQILKTLAPVLVQRVLTSETEIDIPELGLKVTPQVYDACVLIRDARGGVCGKVAKQGVVPAIVIRYFTTRGLPMELKVIGVNHPRYPQAPDRCATVYSGLVGAKPTEVGTFDDEGNACEKGPEFSYAFAAPVASVAPVAPVTTPV